jgi:hypothetical protein
MSALKAASRITEENQAIMAHQRNEQRQQQQMKITAAAAAWQLWQRQKSK